MEIDDKKYDALINFIESGAKGDLSEEMVEYVELLDRIRGWHVRYKDRSTIVRMLQQPPYKLSYYLATKRYSDAINFFYLNNQIRKSAWRNVYAEKLDRAADLVLRTATCADDMKVYRGLIREASYWRELHKPDPENKDQDKFKKKYKIYTLNPERLGMERENRNLLAKHIDDLDIPESAKQRARSDAGMKDTFEIFSEEEESDEQKED